MAFRRTAARRRAPRGSDRSARPPRAPAPGRDTRARCRRGSPRHVQRVEAELDRALAEFAALLFGIGDGSGLLHLLCVLLLDGPDLSFDEVANGVAQLDQFRRDLLMTLMCAPFSTGLRRLPAGNKRFSMVHPASSSQEGLSWPDDAPEGRRRIAQGREAEIFEWDGDAVLKLYRGAGYGLELEAAALDAIASAGGPAPRLLGRYDVDDRPALISRVDGIDMLAMLDGTMAARWAGPPARRRARSDPPDRPPQGLPGLKEFLAARIGAASSQRSSAPLASSMPPRFQTATVSLTAIPIRATSS